MHVHVHVYVIKSVDYRPTVLQAVLPETNECSTVMATSKYVYMYKEFVAVGERKESWLEKYMQTK